MENKGNFASGKISRCATGDGSNQRFEARHRWKNIDEQAMDELAQALSPVDAIYERLHCNKDGTVSQTLPNCMLVLEEDPLFKDAIQFNVLSGRMAVTREMPWSRDGDNFTDDDLHNIFLYMQKTYGLSNDKRTRRQLCLWQSWSLCDWHGSIQRIKARHPGDVAGSSSAQVSSHKGLP